MEDEETAECITRLQAYSSFGEVSFLCNSCQTRTVRACELCRILRLDKQCFTEILEICFSDGRMILNNLLEVTRSSFSSFHLISVLAKKIWSPRYNCQFLCCFLQYQISCVQMLAEFLYSLKILSMFFFFFVNSSVNDSGKIILTLIIDQGKQPNLQRKILESDVTLYIGQRESDLAMRVNCAVYDGDSYRLKRLIRAGADPNNVDYDGRSPLVWIIES